MKGEEPVECREVRELAEAYVSEQILVETAEAIVAHLEHCASCRAEVEGLRRLRASTRSAWLGAKDLAPRPEFVSALTAELRSASGAGRPRSSSRRSWWAIAATLVLVAGGGFGLRGLGVSGFTAIVHAAVGDHRFCAFKLSESPIPLAQAAEIYDDPVDRSLESVAPQPAEVHGEPIRILDRHSCVYQGRRFAHFIVEYKHTKISLVVEPDERLLRLLPGASAPADGSIASVGPVDGFDVAAFRGPRHVAFLIGALGVSDLHDVAASLQASVLRALNR